MVTVRLPTILRQRGAAAEFVLNQSVTTTGELVAALEQGFYNFAVNDALVLHNSRQHPLMPGDTIEIVPVISGGGQEFGSRARDTIGELEARNHDGGC